MVSIACVVEVNVETNKGTAQSNVNEDRALMRSELLEAFMRLACLKYEGVCSDVSECFTMLLEKVTAVAAAAAPARAPAQPSLFRPSGGSNTARSIHTQHHIILTGCAAAPTRPLIVLCLRHLVLTRNNAPSIQVVLPRLPREALFDRDAFRRGRLYTPEVDKVLRFHLGPLKVVEASTHLRRAASAVAATDRDSSL